MSTSRATNRSRAQSNGSKTTNNDSQRVLGTSFHPLLMSLFQQLERGHVRWALLREPGRPEQPEGDVDLLVAEADAAGLERVLAALEFVRLPARGYGSDMFYLSYHPATDHWIWLHITMELCFGPYRTVQVDGAAGCLERSTWDSVARRLAPDDAFWVLLLHCLLDKGKIAAKHRPRLATLAPQARADSPLARAADALLPAGVNAAFLLEAARHDDWLGLERLAPQLERDESPRQVAGVRALRTMTRLKDAQRRGLVVALLGPDGAGKSTLARGIQESFFFPARFIYMGVGPGLLSRIAARLSLLHRPPFTYFAFISTLWLRYLTGQFHRWQGRLVIFDRYSYDALLPMPGGVSALKRKALDIQAWICPPPDLVLVLDVPGEVMFNRKGEFTPEHLEAQRQTLLALQGRIPNVEVLDGTQPRDAVRVEAVQRIWRRYAARLGAE